MQAVKELPCVVCHRSPCDVHHVFHDRYGTRKADDFDTIPLCAWCHQDGPQAIHRTKAAWRATHGPDHGYVAATRRAVQLALGSDIWAAISQHIPQPCDNPPHV